MAQEESPYDIYVNAYQEFRQIAAPFIYDLHTADTCSGDHASCLDSVDLEKEIWKKLVILGNHMVHFYFEDHEEYSEDALFNCTYESQFGSFGKDFSTQRDEIFSAIMQLDFFVEMQPLLGAMQIVFDLIDSMIKCFPILWVLRGYERNNLESSQ